MTWVNLVNAIHRSTVACSCCCLMKHNKGKVNEHAKQSSYNRQTRPVSFVATFLSVASLRLFWLWCNTHLINREFVCFSSTSKEISCALISFLLSPFSLLLDPSLDLLIGIIFHNEACTDFYSYASVQSSSLWSHSTVLKVWLCKPPIFPE